MPETEVKVLTPVLVEYTCDACGSGYMKRDGDIAWGTPERDRASVPHKCNNCGHKQSFTEVIYPVVRYRDA